MQHFICLNIFIRFYRLFLSNIAYRLPKITKASATFSYKSTKTLSSGIAWCFFYNGENQFELDREIFSYLLISKVARIYPLHWEVSSICTLIIFQKGSYTNSYLICNILKFGCFIYSLIPGPSPINRRREQEAKRQQIILFPSPTCGRGTKGEGWSCLLHCNEEMVY